MFWIYAIMSSLFDYNQNPYERDITVLYSQRFMVNISMNTSRNADLVLSIEIELLFTSFQVISSLSFHYHNWAIGVCNNA